MVIHIAHPCALASASNLLTRCSSVTGCGQPIHAYVQYATDPANTWRDWTPQSTNICWTYSSPSTNPSNSPACSGQKGTITLNNVPAGAKVWITVHLDFALKGSQQTSGITKPKEYGPASSYMTISSTQGRTASTSQTSLLGRGKKVSVVYGAMTDASGIPMPNLWVRLTQGSASALALTDSLGGYLFYNGQGCSGDGLSDCSSGINFAFGSESSVSTTVTVIGKRTLPTDPPPIGWASAGAVNLSLLGKSSVMVNWPNGSVNLGSTPSYTFSVVSGSANLHNWKFS